jgi:hypothetical protein
MAEKPAPANIPGTSWYFEPGDEQPTVADIPPGMQDELGTRQPKDQVPPGTSR